MRLISPMALAVLTTFVAARTSLAGVNLVFNGGFETGNFAGWNVPPNVPPPNVNAAFFSVGGAGAHSGNHFASLSSSQFQFVSQFLPGTVAGTEYELEFWLRKTSNAPASLAVRWEGEYVYFTPSQLPSTSSWYLFTVPLHAEFSGSFLEFGQNYFPLEFHVDDIVVRQVPTPSALPLLALGGLVAFRRCRR
ncbi:MAG: hypothetical protein KF869_14530 [Phycisphaeraceae bacterium]|nr:hypothetical protein [Phycisphaeraceae bacterium]